MQGVITSPTVFHGTPLSAGTDHHFHYGYWVAAAAAVASQDLAWYKAHLEPAVQALVRDYANNDKSDPVLPFARHKDWWVC